MLLIGLAGLLAAGNAPLPYVEQRTSDMWWYGVERVSGARPDLYETVGSFFAGFPWRYYYHFAKWNSQSQSPTGETFVRWNLCSLGADLTLATADRFRRLQGFLAAEGVRGNGVVLRLPVWLRLSHTAIDDRALPYVARLPKREKLLLNGCDVSDAGLPPLGRMARLRQLDVSETPVTNQGALQLLSRRSMVIRHGRGG